MLAGLVWVGKHFVKSFVIQTSNPLRAFLLLWAQSQMGRWRRTPPTKKRQRYLASVVDHNHFVVPILKSTTAHKLASAVHKVVESITLWIEDTIQLQKLL